MLEGYFEDIFLSLQEVHRVLRTGGQARVHRGKRTPLRRHGPGRENHQRDRPPSGACTTLGVGHEAQGEQRPANERIRTRTIQRINTASLEGIRCLNTVCAQLTSPKWLSY